MLSQTNEPKTLAQQELLSLWTSIRHSTSLGGVRRSAMDPGTIRRFLSRIVLLEIDLDGSFRVRLSGSSVSRDLGIDPAGRRVDELPTGFAEHITLGAMTALNGNRPVSGSVLGGDGSETKAFLRLPLQDQDGDLRFLLCHDEPIRLATGPFADPIRDDILGQEVQIAA